MLRQLNRKVDAMLAPKQRQNIVQSTYLIRIIRKIAGASVITIKSTSQNVIQSSFTYFGFLSFITWYCVYFYSVYKMYSEDQTILRSLYSTKLKRYGDEVERTIKLIFSLYAMWKVPFDLSGSSEDMQQIVDIDKAIRDLGESLDYKKNNNSVMVICIVQTFIIGTRVFSMWFSLYHLNLKLPSQKVFVVLFTDAVTFIIVAQFCSYLVLLKKRYNILNRILASIKVSEVLISRVKIPRSMDNGSKIQNRFVTDKIKACSNIHSMLFMAAQTCNDKFGFVILLTMLKNLILIILHFFYFMEATAASLFNEPLVYIGFLVYVYWQICFSLAVIYVFIYYSESAVTEALLMAVIVHQIINSNLDSSIRSEAGNLSLQILHQTPKFTAYGLYKLSHEVLLEGARSVTTFLVILLQFVTDKRSN